MTAAVAEVIDRARDPDAPLFLLCDGDLAGSAAELMPLLDAVRDGECDLAIAAFSRRVGGGFGVALRYAAWAIERLSGYQAGAPISGQRALSPGRDARLLPVLARVWDGDRHHRGRCTRRPRDS